jgi:hypothetical protein
MSDVLQGHVLLDDSVDLEHQEHLVNPTSVRRLTRAERAQPIREICDRNGISLTGVAGEHKHSTFFVSF